jgi:uncharacterized protein involved in outer membrane biogenesis
MKKAFKIIGIILGILLLLLILIPFLFKDKIEAKLKETINENVNAKVEWQVLDLSLLRSFPKASVNLENLSVVNNAPFAGDTLFYSKNLALEMGLLQLITSDALSIDNIYVEEASVNLLVKEDGTANYDIAKASEEQTSPKEETTESSNLSLELKSYEIKDSRISYNSADAMIFLMENFNHSGTGDFSQNTFVLSTHTDAKVSFTYEGSNYLNSTAIVLDADLAMDLDQMKFSFEDNKAFVNELPLLFDGFVKLNENSQDVDITFKTPDSDFKNLMALIPSEYSGSLSDIETKGNFDVNGKIYGTVDDTHIPKLDINLNSKNAMLRYKSLPKQFDNVNIDLKIENTTGIVEDTKVNLNAFSFNIAKDQFSGSVLLRDLTENLKADVIAKGVLNLDNLSEAYPIEADLTLNGVLKADIETHFDMKSIENERYENIKSSGSLEVNDFVYSSVDFNNPVNISNALIKFNPKNTRLVNFEMKTGETDLKAQGNLENLIGYMLNDKDLKGNFTATSNRFNLNDFMTDVATENTKEESENKTKTEEATSAETEAFNLPDKLDINLTVDAKEVVYSNFTLRNTTGLLQLKPKAAYITQLQSNIFGGKISLEGDLNTIEKNPKMKMDFKMQDVDIVSAISDVELLKSFTPILKSLVGKITTEFKFSGDLTNDLSPILTSLSGEGLAKIITAKVDTQKMPLVQQLYSSLKGLDLGKLKLEDVFTTFSFIDGNINVQPVNFQVEDIDVSLQGQHSLNNTMSYQAQLNIPAKYFGDDLGSELAKLTKTDLDKMKVNLPLGITGALTSPKLQIDYQAAVKDLKTQIINQQKDELIDKAGDKLNSLLGGNKPSDSTKTDNVKNILGNLIGGKKKKNKEKKDN